MLDFGGKVNVFCVIQVLLVQTVTKCMQLAEDANMPTTTCLCQS